MRNRSKVLMVGMLVIGLMTTTACWGPMQLMRTVDDWTNQTYVENPWLAQVMHFFPVVYVAYFVATTIDIVALNPYDFWGHTVARGKGTGFEHKQPEGAPEVIK